MKKALLLVSAPLMVFCGTVLSRDGNAGENPVELGQVHWGREIDEALAAARQQEKPVFALFQEIPGCSTCQDFGAGPLSHPLLVEAIEDLFVPVAIYNNRGGADAEVLARYQEPSWNNPVVRFLDADGRDVIERRDGVWSTYGIALRSASALEAAGHEVPRWLTVVVAESDPAALETATFSMACFWEGEAQLGSLEGVVHTRAAWAGGKEAVEVRFDPRRIPRAALVERAQQSHCAATAVEGSDAKSSDRKYYLKRSPLGLLPLTPLQQTRINAALRLGSDPAAWLSPRQAELLRRIQAALEKDAGSLHGLEAPESLQDLPAYARELGARLEG